LAILAGWALFSSGWRKTTDSDPTESSPVVPFEIPTGFVASLIPLRDPGYAGPQVCAECHSERVNDCLRTPHFRACREPVEGEMPAGFTESGEVYSSRIADLQFEMKRVGGEYLQTTLDATQGPEQRRKSRVDFLYGVGNADSVFLSWEGDRLYELPMVWLYTENRWAVSHFFPYRGGSYGRELNPRCLECHNTWIDHVPGSLNEYQRDRMILGVTCERCHGPGREHVARHQQGLANTSPDPIVNPRKLPPAQRESVCNQCHLQGLDEVLRYGRTDFDFRPGMHLGDIWTVFVEGTGVVASGKTTAVSHVQQMHASQCFLQSDGRLGCISCHDPHGVPPPDQRPATFNARCLDCHATAGCSLPEPERLTPPMAGSCIACHMPRLNAVDVPHTSQTDHRVLRRPPPPSRADSSPPAEPPVPSESDLQIFDLAEVPLTVTELDRAWGILLAARAEAVQDPALAQRAVDRLQQVWQVDRADGAVADALGISLALTGDTPQAIEVWERGLLANPRSESLLYSLGLAHFTAGRHTEAYQHFDRLVTVNPWRSDYQGQRARVLLALGQMPAALEAASAARELNPALPLVYEWLAFASEQAGQPAEASRYRQLQQRILRR